MTDSDDPFDLDKLKIDPAELPVDTPAKIKRRRGQFITLPMWWYERLAEAPRATGIRCLIAWYLLHLDWKHHGKPFTLANGMLKYDGVSRYSKWRALVDLERRGLITIERRRRRSPTIYVHTNPPT